MQLIYNNPRPLTSPVHWAWISVTIALWLGWASLWTPFMTLAAWMLGFGILGAYFPIQLFLILFEVEENINVLMSGASAVVILVVSWSMANFALFRNRPRPTVYLPATVRDLAASAALPWENLVQWQGAQRLVAYHDPLGKLVRADVVAANDDSSVAEPITA